MVTFWFFFALYGESNDMRLRYRTMTRHLMMPSALVGLGAVLVFAGVPLEGRSATERPNVVLICVDDLKPTLGCYGDRFAKTPNIDQLAARSVRFDSAYCNQAVCSPSRNALLTGLRPQTLGIYDLETNFRAGKADAVTLPQYFKEQGYQTESIGKIFHQGHGNTVDAISWSVPHTSPKAPSYAVKENQPPEGKGQKDARGAATEAGEVADDFYTDGKTARGAIEKLGRLAETGKPFFLAVGFQRPHLPFVSPRKYWDLYRAEEVPMPEVKQAPEGAPAYAPVKRNELVKYQGIPQTEPPYPDEVTRQLIHGYYAATSYMDAQLGLVLDELKRLKLEENTVLVFWGDHGWHLGDHGFWAKHTNYEQAARIPLMVAVPGTSGKLSTQALVESVDLYPTLIELAGLPKRSDLDGRSFASVLRDPALPAREHVTHVYPRNALLGRAIRDGRYRLVEWKAIGVNESTAEYELYDYQSDPLERRNQAKALPDEVARMKAILATYPEARPQVKSVKPTPATEAKPSGKKLSRAEMFRGRDKDGDGKLTREEFLRNQPDPEEAPKRFGRFDRDGDGMLTEEEFVSAGKAAKKP